MYPHKDHPSENGFAYVALLILIAIIGAMAASSMSAGSTMQRRVAEEELLFVGMQFQRAFESYRNATPPGQSPFPERLEDLVRDKRGARVQRHLRKIYVDPLTGRSEWGVITVPGGRIAAVVSMAEGTVIKVSGFPPNLSGIEGKARYSEWIFGIIQGKPSP